jgi:site-specific DNA-cytosine methylase
LARVQALDICKVTTAVHHDLARTTPEIRHVVFVSGSPCQDVSGLSSERTGVEGERSALVHELTRVDKLTIEVFPNATFSRAVENVASIDVNDFKVFSRTRKTNPYRIYQRKMSGCRRPRFYWSNFRVKSCLGVRKTQLKPYVDVTFNSKQFGTGCWLP